MTRQILSISGNHERQLLTLASEQMGIADRHAACSLRSLHRDWIADLPAVRWLSDEVLMVHGTPDSDPENFLETVTEAGMRAAGLEEIEVRVGASAGKVILFGHTHIDRRVPLRTGRAGQGLEASAVAGEVSE